MDMEVEEIKIEIDSDVEETKDEEEDLETIDNIKKFLEDTRHDRTEEESDKDESDVEEYFNAALLREIEPLCEIEVDHVPFEEYTIVIKEDLTVINEDPIVIEEDSIDIKEDSIADISDVDADTDLLETKVNFKCSRCFILFETLRDLVFHNRSVHYKRGSAALRREIEKKLRAKKTKRKGSLVRKRKDKKDTAQLKQLKYLYMIRKKEELGRKFWCIKCYISFNTYNEFIKHKKTSAHAQSVTCEICHKVFKHKYMLRFHIKTHQRDDHRLYVNYKCLLCDETLNTFAKVILHHGEKHENEERCILCSKIIQYGYKNHLKSHRKRLYKCLPCDSIFDTNKELLQHYHSKEHLKVKTCEICNRVFNRPILKRMHMSAQHSNELGIKIEKYQCDVCGIFCSSKPALNRHRIHKHGVGDLVFECHICGVPKLSRRSLKNHLERVHIKNIRQVVCYICYDVLTLKGYDTGESHYQTHPEHQELEEKQTKCPNCNKTPKSEADFFTHTLEVHGRYSCYKCHKSFTMKCSIRNHLKSHDNLENIQINEEGVECLICHNVFKHKSTLRYHMYRHTGQKPYSCKVCDKVFRKPYHVKLHMKTHQKDSFPCDQCGGKFDSKDELKNHLVQDHADKVYCDICDRYYTNHSLLKQHISRMHLGDNEQKKKSKVDEVIAGIVIPPKKYGSDEYQCHFCIRKFKSEQACQNHEKRYHPQKHTDLEEMDMRDILDPRRRDCNYCHRYFKSDYAYHNHLKKAHPHVIANQEGEEDILQETYQVGPEEIPEAVDEPQYYQDSDGEILEIREQQAETIYENGHYVTSQNVEGEILEEVDGTYQEVGEEMPQLIYADGLYEDYFGNNQDFTDEEDINDVKHEMEIVLDQPIEDILEQEGEVCIQTF